MVSSVMAASSMLVSAGGFETRAARPTPMRILVEGVEVLEEWRQWSHGGKAVRPG
jgi:hypothetical protein